MLDSKLSSVPPPPGLSEQDSLPVPDLHQRESIQEQREERIRGVSISHLPQHAAQHLSNSIIGVRGSYQNHLVSNAVQGKNAVSNAALPLQLPPCDDAQMLFNKAYNLINRISNIRNCDRKDEIFCDICKAAELGNLEAQRKLAMIYCSPEWGVYNPREAYRLMMNLSNRDAMGAYNCALWLISRNIDFKKDGFMTVDKVDSEKAERMLKDANLDLENAEIMLISVRKEGSIQADGALAALAVLRYDFGDIQNADPLLDNLVARLQAGAEAGDPMACFELGNALQGGRFGLAPDLAAAHKHKVRAATCEVPYGPAHAYVGEHDKSISHLSIAAECGIVRAQYLYAEMLEQNAAKERSSPLQLQNNDRLHEAVWWWKAASDGGSGHAAARRALRAMVLLEDASKNKPYPVLISERLQFIEIWGLANRAAKMGVPEGKLALALCYMRGIGVEVNKRKGAAMIIEVAENNHDLLRAQYLAGLCYATADGVERNREKAIIMYERAASQYPRAREALARLRQ